MPNKKQIQAKMGTFNSSDDHEDRFYLQPAHEEAEKDGAAEEKGEREQFQGDGRLYLVTLTKLIMVQSQEKLLLNK